MSAARRAKLKARSRVWLELDGEPVFGDGKALMLETIDRTGSLSAAAQRLGMSYRALWGRLKTMERRLSMTLVVRQAGGPGGGGSQLTEDARQLLARYRRFRRRIDKLVDDRFEAAFK